MGYKRKKIKLEDYNIRDEFYKALIKLILKSPLYITICYCVNKIAGKTTSLNSNFIVELTKIFLDLKDFIPKIFIYIIIFLIMVIIILFIYISVIINNYENQINELKGGKND